jgi:hypothetical protein
MTSMSHRRRKEDLFEPDKRDEMLAELWELTEIHDLEAWFQDPWRDGRNAVRLCLALDAPRRGGSVAAWLEEMLPLDRGELTADHYHQADVYRYEVSRTDATRYGVLLDAALAVYANWIAASDGGGHVPNVHLSAAVARLLNSGELGNEGVHETVGLWRARDALVPWEAIGTGGHAARRAAAHRWFWMNRRWAAASLASR